MISGPPTKKTTTIDVNIDRPVLTVKYLKTLRKLKISTNFSHSNYETEDFENDISHSATSLYLEVGDFIQRERLLAAILNHLEILLNELGEDSGSFDINKYWTPYCIHNNKNITFQEGGQIRQGRFTNIAKNGECVIEINGTTQSFTG